MKRESHILKTVADSENLVGAPLPGSSLIEIYDQRRILVENHYGIIGYGCNEILIKVRHGRICVCGENLKLAKMSKEKLVITGRICTVNLQGRG